MSTMTEAPTTFASVADLRRTLRGPLHLPGDAGYDAARTAWNPHADGRPALVAEVSGPADVRAVITWARAHGVPLAVQSTGHGIVAPYDGVALIKTSNLRSVLVDADRRIARVGAGAVWSDVIAAAAPFGLVPLSGSAAGVGVAGYTMGGGVSWLSRRFGFAADSLLRATVVTADGNVVTASRDQQADLFWALRGGGGNFGVATSLDIQLHPVASVYAGAAVFPIARAADTLRRYAEWAATAPDALSTAIVATSASTGRPASFAIRALYSGDDGATGARRALRTLYQVAGTPVSEEFHERSYAETRMPGVAPRSFDLFRQLPDPVISTIVAAVSRADSPASAVEIRHWGGAMAKPAGDAGPVGHRDVPFSIIVDGPADVAAALRPYATGGSFLNFLHAPAHIESAYTAENYQRLRAVKAAYDPANIFRLNHNIAPASAR